MKEGRRGSEEPTLEETYAPVVERYFADKEGDYKPDPRASLDVAIDSLCRELSEDDGPLEKLRQLQAAEDEWAGLRALLPTKDTRPPAWEDRLVKARMEEIRKTRIPALKKDIMGASDDETVLGSKLLILRRLLHSKWTQAGAEPQS